MVPPLNQFFHVRRNWGGEIQVSAGDRVGQGQCVGVESGAGDQVRCLRAVEPVSGQRTADVGHVDPELVGAARFWLQLYEGQAIPLG